MAVWKKKIKNNKDTKKPEKNINKYFVWMIINVCLLKWSEIWTAKKEFY